MKGSASYSTIEAHAKYSFHGGGSVGMGQWGWDRGSVIGIVLIDRISM
jgi:hypothetical protein